MSQEAVEKAHQQNPQRDGSGGIPRLAKDSRRGAPFSVERDGGSGAPPQFQVEIRGDGGIPLTGVECDRLWFESGSRYEMRRTRMKRSLMVIGVAVALMAAWSVGRVQGQKGQAEKVVFVSADQANFGAANHGVSTAVIWGDSSKGAHATFTKFAPGQDNGMHTHTNDVWIVVLKGAYLYKDEAGEKRVGPSDFLRVPGGHKHWSGGDAKEGALFYEESSGKFDLIPVK
jgi:quercetin dioxygenase-like cupin family protein